MAHVVKCLRCNKTSQRDQTFLELDINLKKNATLEDCIENSFQVETLSGDNRYRCQHCKSLQNAERWTVMRRLPPVLNISLMRFKYNASGRVKSKDKIRYKRIMQLGGVAWKLKAAVVHVGASVSSRDPLRCRAADRGRPTTVISSATFTTKSESNYCRLL